MATPQEIRTLLNGADNKAKTTLLQTMVKIPAMASTDEIVQRVTALTKDGDMAVRFWAKKVVARLPKPEFPPPLPPEPVQPPAFTLNLLLKKLESAASESSFVGMDTIKKLCESRDERALEPLIDYLGRCKDPVQISFLTKNLGIWFPSEDLLPTLMPYLRRDDDRICANVCEGLEAIGSPKCVVIFSQLLDHRSNRVRANAAKALSNFDPAKTNEILYRMLAMQDKPHFIISACHAIGAPKAKGFLPQLDNLLEEDLFFCDALKAVENIGGPEAIGILNSALSDFSDEEKQNELNAALTRLERGYLNINLQKASINSNPPVAPTSSPSTVSIPRVSESINAWRAASFFVTLDRFCLFPWMYLHFG